MRLAKVISGTQPGVGEAAYALLVEVFSQLDAR